MRSGCNCDQISMISGPQRDGKDPKAIALGASTCATHIGREFTLCFTYGNGCRKEVHRGNPASNRVMRAAFSPPDGNRKRGA